MSDGHKMEIRDHALIYALLAREIFGAMPENKAQEIIRDITVLYGHNRGQRMRQKADAAHEAADLAAYLIHGEWKGREGENQSTMEYGENTVASSVTKCAWYETWKEYGLLPYGTYYCRYIDQALCEGFGGSFWLDIPSSMGKGDSQCLFVWSEAVDEQFVAKEKKRLNDAYILPFDFHVKELLECARQVLREKNLEYLADKTLEEYKKLA